DQRRDRLERGRLRDGIRGKEIGARWIVGDAGRWKIGGLAVRRLSSGRRSVAGGPGDHRVAAEQSLLFQVFARQGPPVAPESACSTSSRIRSATSRLDKSGSSVGAPLFRTIVTRFVGTSNPAPGSSASFKMTKSSALSCNFWRARATPSPPSPSRPPVS